MSLQSELITTTNNCYFSTNANYWSWKNDYNAINDSNIWNENRTNKIITKSPKKKRVRTIFTTKQIEKLEEEFLKSEYINKMDRLKIASILNLNEQKIKIWFQNRRMKKKRDSINSFTSDISSNFIKEDFTKTTSTFSSQHYIPTSDYYNGQQQYNNDQENYFNQDCQYQYNMNSINQLPSTELEYSLYYQTFELPTPVPYCT